MSEQKNKITLYPSNWLYNAGVLGIIRVLKGFGYDVNSDLKKDGSFLLDLDIISNYEKLVINGFKISKFGIDWLLESYEEIFGENELNNVDKVQKIWGTLFNVFYRGFFNANSKLLYSGTKKSKPVIEQFENYISSFTKDLEPKTKCFFCHQEANATYKNNLTSEHSKILGTSSGEKGVPNSFWNLNKENSISICDYCSFIIISNHLSRIKLSDNSEIFINAPSFKVMYELNKFVKGAYENKTTIEARTKRDILATSVIEYTNKIKTSLGIWTGMNIEIVTKKNDVIEYYSLPYDVVKILTDRQIASLLSDLGEYNIYNTILDNKYSDLVEIAYKILREGNKDYSRRNEKIINALLYQWKNKNNLVSTANKIMKLYSLIDDKIKRS